jgi:hypothetical protein
MTMTPMEIRVLRAVRSLGSVQAQDREWLAGKPLEIITDCLGRSLTLNELRALLVYCRTHPGAGGAPHARYSYWEQEVYDATLRERNRTLDVRYPSQAKEFVKNLRLHLTDPAEEEETDGTDPQSAVSTEPHPHGAGPPEHEPGEEGP